MRRFLVIGVFVSLAGALAVDLAGPSQAHRRVIAVRDPDNALPDWSEVVASQDEAGYRWAARNRVARAADCPGVTEEFRFGCLDWLQERAAVRAPS